jgi:hypothetical protein
MLFGENMKYKVTNRTFSPLQISGVGIIPARGSIIVNRVSKDLKVLEKENMISIREIKEK